MRKGRSTHSGRGWARTFFTLYYEMSSTEIIQASPGLVASNVWSSHISIHQRCRIWLSKVCEFARYPLSIYNMWILVISSNQRTSHLLVDLNKATRRVLVNDIEPTITCTGYSFICCSSRCFVDSTWVLWGCTSLVDFSFEDGCCLSELPYRTFYGCGSLGRFVVPRGVSSLGRGCTSLADFLFEGGCFLYPFNLNWIPRVQANTAQLPK